MRVLSLILLLCALFAPITTRAAGSTIVRLDTNLGSMTFQLYDDAKPVTVANFLRYIRDGRYANSFAHRLVQSFVLQGGGFTLNNGSFAAISTYDPIVNEAGPFPAYSNVLGTLAMAKISGDPNSATSEWFLNLADNSSNLDSQNGGFTVFGTLTSGSDVLQKFNAFQNYNNTDGSDLVVNLTGSLGSGFDAVPVALISGGQIAYSDFIYTTWTILSTPAPTVSITGRKSVVTHHPSQAIEGMTAGLLDSISYRVGTKGGWKKASLTGTKWKITARPLIHGRNLLTIIARGPGGSSAPTKISIVRK